VSIRKIKQIIPDEVLLLITALVVSIALIYLMFVLEGYPELENEWIFFILGGLVYVITVLGIAFMSDSLKKRLHNIVVYSTTGNNEGVKETLHEDH
jgi:hypothetical protein